MAYTTCMQPPDIPSDQPLADEFVRLLAAHRPLTYEQVSESFGEDGDVRETTRPGAARSRTSSTPSTPHTPAASTQTACGRCLTCRQART
jgi:hypothetical protein